MNKSWKSGQEIQPGRGTCFSGLSSNSIPPRSAKSLRPAHPQRLPDPKRNEMGVPIRIIVTMKFYTPAMPEKSYDHNQIELKWFDRWENSTFYRAEENSTAPKFYVLEMLPYPSGALHI